MDTLKKHAVEAVIAVWLFVVAVQYLSRYFFNIDVDFTYVYVGMLSLCAVVIAMRAVRAVFAHFGGKR